MNTLQQQYPERVKEIMKRKGISIGKIARDMQIDIANASRLINGKTNPTLKTLDILSEVLGEPVLIPSTDAA